MRPPAKIRVRTLVLLRGSALQEFPLLDDALATSKISLDRKLAGMLDESCAVFLSNLAEGAATEKALDVLGSTDSVLALEAEGIRIYIAGPADKIEGINRERDGSIIQ
jgi:hypothetical protein